MAKNMLGMVVVSILAIGLLVEVSKIENWQTKYTTTMNAYADLWCQKQQYVEVLNYTDTQYENMTCYAGLEYKTLKSNGDIEYTYAWVSVQSEQFNPPNISGISLELINCPKAQKTHQYTTGRYLPDENKIECLGEVVNHNILSGSSKGFDFFESLEYSKEITVEYLKKIENDLRNPNRHPCMFLHILNRTEIPYYEDGFRYKTEYICYEKSRKFEVPITE